MTMVSKPTIDDIEAHGYKVLTKSEYEDFVRLYEAVKNWRYGLIDKHDKLSGLAATYPAIYRLATTFDEVEAIQK